MRVAVLSDIHANLFALERVAIDLADAGVDQVWCLGDVVGYGGQPRECLAWVESHADVFVKGNHDEAVATGDVQWFNPFAARAARLHAQLLTPPERSRIFAWPTVRTIDIDGMVVLVVHASPDDPLHEYVQPTDAEKGLQRWSGRAGLILMGHTHRPFAAFLAARDTDGAPATAAADGSGAAWRGEGFEETVHGEHPADAPLLLLNPGSVGQPRDGDPRASYAVVDFARRRVELRRVTYDVDAAAQSIIKAGLDPMLALRLFEGR